MSIHASRGSHIVLATVAMFLSLALFAQAAHATHGRLQVVKINQGGSPDDTFAFHPSVTSTPSPGSFGDFAIKGGQAGPALDVPCTTDRTGHTDSCAAHWSNVSISVSERPAPGYALSDITCRYTQSQDDTNAFSSAQPNAGSAVKPAGELAVDLATGTVHINVMHYDEWVVCYFTNTKSPVTLAPIAQTAPSLQAPQTEVKSARARPGAARIQAHAGCATSNVVVASVTGRHVKRVTFYVDHKKIKTLTRPNRSGGRWMLSKRLRHLTRGPHRVRARVEFTKSSATAPKMLPVSISRCGSGAVKPQFTG